MTETEGVVLIHAGREIGGSRSEFVTTDVTDFHG
jgi:hypothetical protein